MLPLHNDGTLNTYMLYDMKNNWLEGAKIYWYCISILRTEMMQELRYSSWEDKDFYILYVLYITSNL